MSDHKLLTRAGKLPQQFAACLQACLDCKKACDECNEAIIASSDVKARCSAASR
jgi:hypothetical protein